MYRLPSPTYKPHSILETPSLHHSITRYSNREIGCHEVCITSQYAGAIDVAGAGSSKCTAVQAHGRCQDQPGLVADRSELRTSLGDDVSGRFVVAAWRSA